MPTRETAWPTGVPCWIDMMTTDVEGAQNFYSALFGWQFADHGPQYGGYHLATSDGKQVAGLGPVMHEGEPVVWTTYFATDDIHASVGKITEAGGTVMVTPMEVPEMGWMAIAVDPQGAVFGLWQASGMTGTQRFNEPNSPRWNDLHTTSLEQACEFYATVFGVTVQKPTKAGAEDYREIVVDGDVRAGITELEDTTAGASPYWLAWIDVADIEQTVAAATQAGATIAADPFDIPWGRAAVITDPYGATFAVMTMAQG